MGKDFKLIVLLALVPFGLISCLDSDGELEGTTSNSSETTSSGTETGTVNPGGSDADEGDLFYNTTDDVLYVNDGGAWVPTGASGASNSILLDADPATNLSGTAGDIAYNSTSNELEYFNGTSWVTTSAGAAGDDLGDHTATESLKLGSNLLVGNGGSTGIAIDTAGNVGIGTTAPNTKLDVQNSAASWETASRTSLANLTLNSAYDVSGTGEHRLTFSKSRGTLETPEAAQNGDFISRIVSSAYDGSSYAHAATIKSIVDGVVGVGDMPGRLEFSTTPDGTRTPLVRMTIKETGNVGIGTTSPDQELVVAADNFVEIQTYSKTLTTGHIGGTRFSGNDSNGDKIHYAGIQGYIDNNVTGSTAGSLIFNTTGSAGSLVEHARILSNGNVGIGITTPESKLDVAGAVRFGTGSAKQINGQSYFNNSPNGSGAYYHVKLPHNSNTGVAKYGSFHVSLEGYNYGGATGTGKIIDVTCVGYFYSVTGTLINTACIDKSGGGHNPVSYKGSDGHVYIRIQSSGSDNYMNFHVDYKEVQPLIVRLVPGDLVVTKDDAANL